MKNKSMLIVIVLCMALLPGVSYGLEAAAPSYWQRLKNYIAESRIGQWYATADFAKADPIWRKKLQSVASSGWTGLKRTALMGSFVGGAYGLSYGGVAERAPREFWLALRMMLVGALVFNSIDEDFNAYNKGSLSEAEVVAQIKEIINNRLLKKCHTNEEKLALLANRDYFIAKFKKAGKTDKELEARKEIIDEVFNELAKEQIVEGG